MRDSQKSKLYRAERPIQPLGARFKTVPECQAFIDRTLARKRVQAHYRLARWGVEVRPGFGHRNATGGHGVIQAPIWARSEVVLLHELAHTLVGTQIGHGWQFAECFLFLVREVMGVPAGEGLKASFKAHQVRFRKPPAKRTVTPEQREVLAARLAAYRAAQLRDTH